MWEKCTDKKIEAEEQKLFFKIETTNRTLTPTCTVPSWKIENKKVNILSWNIKNQDKNLFVPDFQEFKVK